MKPFSITAPEEIAKDYGGDKRKIQQAAARGLIDPTSAVLAGMFIDRIRGAAAKEQAAQPSVAEQVMNPMPQPQMPSAGLAASPQAAQMQQPAAPRMGQPAMGRMPQPAPAQMPPAQQPPMQQPMGMAMGGGLDSIDYVEGSYAPGGIVSFSTAGGVSADEVSADRTALLERRNELENELRTARIQGDRDALTGQINAIDRRLEATTSQGLTGLEQGKAMERQAQAEFAAAANQQVPNIIPGGTDYPTVPTAPGQLDFELPAAPPANLYGPEGRTDPDRFDTGTLTEEEAMRIAENQKQGAFGAVPFEESPLGQGLSSLRNLFTDEARIENARSARRGIAAVGEGAGDVFSRAANFRGFDDEGMTLAEKISNPLGFLREEFGGQPEPDAYTGATMPAPEPDTVEDQTAQTQQQTTTPEPETETQQTTLADQVEEVNKATEDLKPNTVEKDDPNAAKTALDAANAEADAMTKAAQTTADDEFTKRIEELMDPAAKGEFRKETEALVKNREERLKSAKKEAFSMALLQAGLGMLGQGGGQTALQALGKAALPATKDYAAAIKDAKKEDRELLQLGLSLEQMDAKEAAATKRVVAQLHGDRAKAMLNSATSMANNVRTTAASKYSADVSERVGMARAEAMQKQAENQSQLTGALRVQSQIDRVGQEINSVRAEAREALENDRALMVLNNELTRATRKQDTQKIDDLNLAIQAREREIYDSKGYTSQLEGLRARQNELYDLFSSLDTTSGSGFTVKRVQ